MNMGTLNGINLIGTGSKKRDSKLTGVLRGEGLPIDPWVSYPLALAIFGAALALRFAILPVEGGYGFITFYPAVILTALLFGTQASVLVVALSAAVVSFVFMPPYWSMR
jgi:hypothetical protein